MALTKKQLIGAASLLFLMTATTLCNTFNALEENADGLLNTTEQLEDNLEETIEAIQSDTTVSVEPTNG